MKIIAFCIAIFIIQITLAQHKEIKVNVTKAAVVKRFDKTYKSIRLSINIKDLKIDANNLIRLKKITKAVSDSGEKLEHETLFLGDDFTQTNNLKIEFKKPSKQIKSITALQGVIEYFQITKKNNSLITEDDILHKYHINLFQKSSLPLKLVLINEAQFFKLRWTKQDEYNKTLQRLKDKEKIGDTINYFFKQFFAEVPLLGENFEDYYKDVLVFYIEDDKDLFFDAQLFNNQGERVDLGYEINPNDHKLTIRLKEGYKSLDKNLKLKIKLKTVASIRELKFAITDILIN